MRHLKEAQMPSTAVMQTWNLPNSAHSNCSNSEFLLEQMITSLTSIFLHILHEQFHDITHHRKRHHTFCTGLHRSV